MELLKKIFNRETLLYIVFGAATTVVNYLVFYLAYRWLFGSAHSVLANAIAFVAAVIFAFVVNKKYVFESKSWEAKVLRREIPSFLAGRIGSFLLEEAALFLVESVLRLGGVTLLTVFGMTMDWVTVTKLLMSVVVVILNYVFCKFFVF